jgi:hypothetical protein
VPPVSKEIDIIWYLGAFAVLIAVGAFIVHH